MNDVRQRHLSGAIVGLVGILALTVPLFDIWEDIIAQGDRPWTTVIENLPLLFLSGTIIASGVWLAASGWENQHTRIVARLTLGTTVGMTALMALVVGIQSQLQGELKPIIIAADAIIVGTIGGILIGVRTAQQEQAIDEANRQRARAEALFDNHTEAVAFVTINNGDLAVTNINDEFRAMFGYDADENENFRTLLPAGDTAAKDLITESAKHDRVRHQVTRETMNGEREFIRQTIPLETVSDETREAYIVYTDITEQKEQEQQLEFLNSLLRHDIQNGMTVIRSRAEYLAETLDGREAEFATTIENRSDDLAKLTDRFRVMLNALTGDIDEERTPRSLPGVIDEQVEVLRTSYPSAAVTTDVPSDLEVLADGLLENVVWNLLSNAVEHNDKENPRVAVRASSEGENIRIEVADNGPGIPDGLKTDVFRRQESGVRNEVGSGFGLFFIDQMVTRYGGDIWIEDNDPEGAVFVMTLLSA